jgi:hypothetical protein
MKYYLFSNPAGIVRAYLKGRGYSFRAASPNNASPQTFRDNSRHFATEKDTRKARYTARTTNRAQNTNSPQGRGGIDKITQQLILTSR